MSRLVHTLDLDGTASITAHLGPTNTGKTYRAIQRMLSHRTGMIGLPLRLLAREVYDRVVEQRGADVVALVTGEEKRVPPGARYFVCTVEAMPVDRPVAFLAVDEIQLAADRTRGHVFTDRILHARGLFETMFMGSDTIEELLQELVPTVQVQRHPRLSRLRCTGATKLTALPPRSAVVAFSAREVYVLAERLRAQRGGVAVVLGALSPRARNAQVAMYQSGEVRYLVATDAIGMGLNMDLSHVAFAAQAKYDGRGFRALRPAELAQVAGRAGRHRAHGSFGTTAGCEPLAEEVVCAIEQHRFERVRRVYWRNADLDFRSPERLLQSLDRGSGHRFFIPMREADDHRSLEAVLRDPEVAREARTERSLALLWEVCSIPDYRKTLTDDHARLLARVFLALHRDGRLSADWVDRRVRRLDRTEGDIETLMARIAYIRTWTYISFRSTWLADARHWQERTQAVEDRLSDALHERLTARFVDRRAVALRRQLHQGGPVEAEVDGERIRVAGVEVGELRGLGVSIASARSPAGQRVVRRAVAAAIRPILARQVQRITAAADEELRLDLAGGLCWQGDQVAKIVGQRDPLLPAVRLLQADWLSAQERRAVEQRLTAWLRQRVQQHFVELEQVAHGPARGIAFAVQQGLGAALREGLARQIATLEAEGRRSLARHRLRMGRVWIYDQGLWSPEALRLRAVLWSARSGAGLPALPSGLVHPAQGWPAGGLAALGYDVVAGWGVRMDALEEIAAWARRARRRRRRVDPARVARRLGSTPSIAEELLQGLGRHRPPRRGA